MAHKWPLFDFHNLNKRRCFVCGVTLRPGNRTEEHVFPKWLQRAANLWNDSIVLLNHTAIPYRQLTVQCCTACNSGPLAALENKVRHSILGGWGEFRKLNYSTIFKWCVKIYLGILTKEYGLLADRRRKHKGRILSKQGLRAASTLHALLQSVRHEFEYCGAPPASIYTYRVHKYDGPNDFDYFDSCFSLQPDSINFRPGFAIRFNGIGIICLFLDGGLHKENLAEAFYKHGRRPLHPAQFLDYAALAFEGHCSIEELPYYLFAYDTQKQVMQAIWNAPPWGFKTTPFNYERFASSLFRLRAAKGLAQPIEEHFRRDFPGNGKWHTYLQHPDGTPLFVTRNMKPCKSQKVIPRRTK